MYSKVKVKFILEQATKAQRGSRVYIYFFFNLEAKCGGWSKPRTGRFTPEKDQVPILQEAGWVSRPVWTGAGNLALSNIRTPDRPSQSESLYRLRYIGSHICTQNTRKYVQLRWTYYVYIRANFFLF